MASLIGLQASLLGGQVMTEVEQQPVQPEANGAVAEHRRHVADMGGFAIGIIG